MTSPAELHRSFLGPVGLRLLVAFVLVALASVAVVTAAGLMGSVQGLDALAARQEVADQAAARAAAAYSQASGWQAADLAPADSVVSSAGASLVVRDSDGRPVGPDGGRHGGRAQGAGTGRESTAADVVVDGRVVGSVRVIFGSDADTEGRWVAWTWILVAAILALAIAFIAAVIVSRWLTAPIARLAATARAFARGDRGARPTASDASSPTELGDLARAFTTAAEDVELSETVRRRMSADVAHELRTPLAALQAGLEEMRDGLVPADTEALQRLHDQSLRLGRVVEDLAILSAAETASFTLRREPTDLASLTHEAVAVQGPPFDEQGIHLSLTPAVGTTVAPVDPDRIHQALANLLSNAVRYCRPGDRVTVSVTGDDQRVSIAVADDGPGIPLADQPHVFERFWRGTHGRQYGSGIGLAVVREIIEAHGGHARVSSTPGGGSTFTLDLPR